MQICVNCSAQWMDSEAVPVEDLVQRVKPGQPMPSGQCPSCNGLCRQLQDEYSIDWLERLQTSMNTLAREINTIRELLDEVDAPPTCFAVGGVLADCYRMLQRTFSNELRLTLVDENFAKALEASLAELQEEPPVEIVEESPPDTLN